MQLTCPKCRAGVEVSDDTTDALFLCPTCDAAEPQPEERTADAEPNAWKFKRKPFSGARAARRRSARQTAAVIIGSCSVVLLLFGYVVFSAQPPRAAVPKTNVVPPPAPTPTPLFEPVSIKCARRELRDWEWLSDASDRSLAGSGGSQAARIEWFDRGGPQHVVPNSVVVTRSVAGLRGSAAVSDADLWALLTPAEPFGLDLSHTRVTAEGLWALCGCDNLRVLLLADEQVTDDVLRVLKALNLLHTLAQAYPVEAPWQWHTGPDDVRWFALAKTQVTAAGLAELSELRSLSALWLHQGQVSVEGVRALTALPALTQLRLSQRWASDAQPITGRDVEENDEDRRQAVHRIAGIAGLTTLDLRHYGDIPGGPLIGELTAYKSLRHLVVDFTDAWQAILDLRPDSSATHRQRENLRAVLAKLSTLRICPEEKRQYMNELAREMPAGRVIPLTDP